MNEAIEVQSIRLIFNISIPQNGHYAE